MYRYCKQVSTIFLNYTTDDASNAICMDVCVVSYMRYTLRLPFVYCCKMKTCRNIITRLYVSFTRNWSILPLHIDLSLCLYILTNMLAANVMIDTLHTYIHIHLTYTKQFDEKVVLHISVLVEKELPFYNRTRSYHTENIHANTDTRLCNISVCNWLYMNNTNGVTGPPKVSSVIAPVSHTSHSAANSNMSCPAPPHHDAAKNAGSSWFSSLSPGSDNGGVGSGVASSGSGVNDRRSGSVSASSSSSSSGMLWLLGSVLAIFAAGWASHSWYMNNMSDSPKSNSAGSPASPSVRSPAGSPRPTSARPMWVCTLVVQKKRTTLKKENDARTNTHVLLYVSCTFTYKARQIQ